MKLNIDESTDQAQIQLLPLIDVIFCILTFFILASLQLAPRQRAISLSLPQATTGQVQQQPEKLIVTIDSAGQTYVDRQLVDRVQLFQMIKEYHNQKPDGLLVLNAAQTAFYNDVVQVLDILRSVGGDRVALATATAPPSPNPSPTASPNPLVPGLSPGLPGASPAPAGVTPGFPGGLTPGAGGLTPGAGGLTPGAGGLTPGAGGLTPNPGQVNPLQPSLPGQTAPNPAIAPGTVTPPPAGSGSPQ